MNGFVKKILILTLGAIIVIGGCAGDRSDLSEADYSKPDSQPESDSSRDTAASGNPSKSEAQDSSAEDSSETSSEPVETLIGIDPENYFQDAVFIGDSITEGLKLYKKDMIPGAKFLSAGSYSVANAMSGVIMPSYENVKYEAADGLQYIGARKVFIMLGMNDIGIYSFEKTIERWEIYIAGIRDKNPGIIIFIQSMTPVTKSREKKDLNNEKIDSFNLVLKDFAETHDCTFIDINSVLKDEEGCLKKDFCSDGELHLTRPGITAWAEVLRSLKVREDQL